MSEMLYLCDKLLCRNCTYPTCKYTTDITHAKNFSYDGIAEVWFEDPSKQTSETVDEEETNV